MEHRIFKRKIYRRMLEWKNTRKGETALLIKGARRVGKSTIACEFARNEYESFINIDFTTVSPDVMAMFENIDDLDFLFLRLQTLFNVTLVPRKSVIIFDEVQKCPAARQAIKHLVSDGRYDYIETGSLLSIRKNIQGIVIPSEETRIAMYPLDFDEFLWALDDNHTADLIKYAFTNSRPLGDAVHRQIMRQFRLYMLVGGMPQAVNKYLDANNFVAVDQVKREIIELYIDDLQKIDNTGRASRIFESIPAELSRGKLSYTVSSVIPNSRPDQLESIWKDLEDSLTVNISYRCTDPNVGMGLHKDYRKFKLYLADTGLFITLAFWDRDVSENIIYNKLLSDKLSADLGYVYENIVAQCLKAAGNSLYYYTFPTNASGKNNYEIDFMVAEGSKISPIEVKSSGYKSHASLDAFADKYPSRISHQFLLYTKDLRREAGITYLPVYMAGLL